MKKRLNFLGVIDGFLRSLALIRLGGEVNLELSFRIGELGLVPSVAVLPAMIGALSSIWTLSAATQRLIPPSLLFSRDYKHKTEILSNRIGHDQGREENCPVQDTGALEISVAGGKHGR